MRKWNAKRSMHIPAGVALTATLGLIVAGLAGPARADSLFNPAAAGKHGAGLYEAHPVQLEVGDIVKVRVREKTTADIELGLENKDSAKGTGSVTRTGGIFGRLLTPLYKLLGTGDLGYDVKSDAKDDGTTDRRTRLDGVVTALVVEKRDGGNLVIEGRKKVLVNAEEQTLIVRGVIDPRDLDEERMIDSDLIADVEIEYAGQGQLTKRMKPGFLSRVIDMLF
jgi:flagellar L-ring protein precursor FlgH